MVARILFRVRNQWAGFLALFLVLAGGTAWAVEHNSIGTKQIKPGAVQSSDLADDAVTSSKIPNGSLLGKDFAAGEIPEGATGPTGPAGHDGSAATAGRIHAVGSSSSNTVSPAFPLLAGLTYVLACTPGANNRVHVVFHTVDSSGTANLMAIGSGIETPTTDSQSAFNIADGAQAAGFPFDNTVAVAMGDATGSAQAESQLIIDVGARTYSVALHIYHRVSDGYCEATGTATLAE